MNKRIVITGALLIVLSIILGAFGAHALKDYITTEKLSSFEVGVRYQMYSGLTLLIIGLSADKLFSQIRLVFLLQLTGIVLFSGSIYLLALSDLIGNSMRFMGPVTPIGGFLIIMSWLIFIVQVIRQKN
jgi:uncharacterized membrane protein YgdD (TMEM256/DUF423 family)